MLAESLRDRLPWPINCGPVCYNDWLLSAATVGEAATNMIPVGRSSTTPTFRFLAFQNGWSGPTEETTLAQVGNGRFGSDLPNNLVLLSNSTRLAGSGDSCSRLVLVDTRAYAGHVRIPSELQTSVHLIVGGDFKSPPYDDALAPLRDRLFDAFRKAGHGRGATGTNDYPLFRVDQIWVSQGFRPESVTAQNTMYSDHRMVVCDLTMPD